MQKKYKKYPYFIRIFKNSIRIFSPQKKRINLFLHIKLYIKYKEKRADEKVVFQEQEGYLFISEKMHKCKFF